MNLLKLYYYLLYYYLLYYYFQGLCNWWFATIFNHLWHFVLYFLNAYLIVLVATKCLNKRIK